MRGHDDRGWVQAGEAASSILARIASEQRLSGTEPDASNRNLSSNARQEAVRGARLPAGRPER